MRIPFVVTAFVLTAVVSCLIFSTPASGEEETKAEKPLVQIAILLDTSNSMDGLINQAKAQLWSIVTEFAKAKKEGVAPDLWVALYEYGNNNLPASEGYIRMVVPLSQDLDKISEELFALRTNGGQEYCGMVIEHSVENLKWSESNSVYKAIFIAGNEPFTQGSVDYKEACRKAIEKGIIVNTIHCGSEEEGIRGMWKDGADLADGQYMVIDQDRTVAHIKAPQDEKIIELNSELNKTYIAYGAMGREGKARQSEMDKDTEKIAPEVAAQRIVVKANYNLYMNKGWDLVDATNEKEVKLEDIKVEDLPEEMKKMTLEEKKQYVEEKNKQRQEIQAEIKRLNAEREKHIAGERKKLAGDKEDTLGESVIKAIRSQAEKKDFNFEGE